MICFALDGTIPHAYLNFQGSLHGSNVARHGGLYYKLDNVCVATRGICVADFAFADYNDGLPEKFVPDCPLSRAWKKYINKQNGK